MASPPSKPPAPPRHTCLEGWSTCATWARAGGSRWLRPLQATCPAPLATLVGLEHVRHLGPMGGQVAPGGFGPSKPPACPPSPHLEGRSTCATWRKFDSETENPSHGRAGCQTRAFPLLPALQTGTVGCVNEGLRRSSAATINVRRRHKPGASTRPARAFGVAANAAGAGGCAAHAPLLPTLSSLTRQ